MNHSSIRSGQFRGQKSLGPLEISLDLSNYEIFPHKILKSRTFKKSSILIVIMHQFANTTQQMEQLVNAWRCGDHAALAEVLFSTRDTKAALSAADQAAIDQLMYRMFDERNAGMENRIREYLNSGKGDYFVVVGAGHLLGEGSVVDLLQQQGYQVTPVRVQ